MWIWRKIVAKQQESIWQERLATCSGLVISEGCQASKITLEVYSEQQETGMVLLASYGGSMIELTDKDWVAATAPEQVPPLLIRNKLVISTSDQKEELEALRQKYPGRHILTVPAEMAFGTGNHATTSTCLRLLCDEARRRKRGEWTLTDVGCGTGVLALAGLKLGARFAWSFDFDPVAVNIAQRNISRNGGSDHIRLFQADVFSWIPEEKCDVVLANLFSTVLQQAFPRLIAAMKPDGVLIISGILRSQMNETLNVACHLGLQQQRIVTRGKWSTALLKLS